MSIEQNVVAGDRVPMVLDPRQLIPYERNNKIHTDEAILELADSMIGTGGFNRSVSIDESMGLLAGHKSTKAAILNIERGFSEYEEIPVLMVKGLSEAQKKAYIMADNRQNDKSDYDFTAISEELKSLDAIDFDINFTGFDASFILPDEPEEGLTPEDEAPDVPENPVSVLGDVWLCGEHRVMCGDSISVTDMDLLMNGNIATMVFTDPPYGINYQSNWRTASEKFEVLENDDKLLDIAPILELYSTGWMFIWTTWKFIDKWINQTQVFGYPSNMVVWSKGGGGIGDLKKTFSTDYEMALVFNRGAHLKGKRIGSVWSIGKDRATEYKHPTQKPVELATEAIEKTTTQSEKVLDLFGGSGSTLIACEKIPRQCFMMELSLQYCDVIINRWQNFTDKKATLESTGETFEEVKNNRDIKEQSEES